ncbi:Humj1 family protein [Senna tora]|uniref:Humj1 family protein n=1 Tax=Senna tora TaxID=362788 RepID=A0A834X6V4_9FABA|nr:Humj1 family protein [Senna tora]
MTAPNMETITASLERSLQNFSLNSHNHHSSSSSEGEGEGADVADDGIAMIGSSSSSSHHNNSNSDATLDLNSHISLPYHWEQCLDLKTGEIYYINWRNGMKAKEDPRRIMGVQSGEYYYSEEEESWYDSEESSSESWPSSSKEHTNSSSSNNNNNQGGEKQNNVLVVAGCKNCLMYFMVPKQVQHCPKCTDQLLHFDRGSDSERCPRGFSSSLAY